MTDMVNQAGIGIDFGTSNSAAAIFDGKHLTMVELESDSAIMPSATYIDKHFVSDTGQEAIDSYITQNQGRKVELSLEVLGEARTSTGQMDPSSRLPTEADTNLVYGQAFNDGSLPGRLFRGTKRLLGAKETDRIMVFSRPFRLVALITPILVRIRKSIEETLAKLNARHSNMNSASHACIGHPVNFEGHDKRHNNIALSRLSESYKHAGIKTQSYYPEPTAATLSYFYANPQHQSEQVLTVDFGGGTLDLSILKREADHFDVVAIHGVGLGGDHIDKCIFEKALFPLLGKGERWRREVDGKVVETVFPFDDYEDLLLNWTVSYMLNQNKYTTPVIDLIKQAGASAIKFQRLYELITQNYCYQVFQAIKDCKAELSRNETAILNIPEIDAELTIKRDDFEAMITAQLIQFQEAVTNVLAKANLKPEDIDLVLRTGGSSLIPAFKNILEKDFPNKVVEHDPFTSVAAGLAIASYYGYGHESY